VLKLILETGIALSSIPSVGLCVRKVHCGKMADWMPLGMVSRVDRGIGVFDG